MSKVSQCESSTLSCTKCSNIPLWKMCLQITIWFENKQARVFSPVDTRLSQDSNEKNMSVCSFFELQACDHNATSLALFCRVVGFRSRLRDSSRNRKNEDLIFSIFSGHRLEKYGVGKSKCCGPIFLRNQGYTAQIFWLEWVESQHQHPRKRL